MIEVLPERLSRWRYWIGPKRPTGSSEGPAMSSRSGPRPAMQSSMPCERSSLDFVAFPTDACLDAVALWVAHAYLVMVGESTPRLGSALARARIGKDAGA